MSDHPVHDWFELTYADYVVLPRTVLQSLPKEIQEDFVKVMDQIDAHCNWRRNGCWVKFRDEKGHFVHDELADYQRGRRILTPEEINEITEKHNAITI